MCAAADRVRARCHLTFLATAADQPLDIRTVFEADVSLVLFTLFVLAYQLCILSGRGEVNEGPVVFA